MKSELKRKLFQLSAVPHLDRLVALASHWVDENEVEDCVHRTYVRAWAAFDQLGESEAVFPWLCGILRGVAGERLRRRVRRPGTLSAAELEAVHEDVITREDPDGFYELLARIDPGGIREAMGVIPGELAEAVELHDVHGLKYREIAAVTSLTRSTVANRISRGRRMLAGFLVVVGDSVARRGAA